MVLLRDIEGHDTRDTAKFLGDRLVLSYGVSRSRAGSNTFNELTRAYSTPEYNLNKNLKSKLSKSLQPCLHCQFPQNLQSRFIRNPTQMNSPQSMDNYLEVS